MNITQLVSAQPGTLAVLIDLRETNTELAASAMSFVPVHAWALVEAFTPYGEFSTTVHPMVIGDDGTLVDVLSQKDFLGVLAPGDRRDKFLRQAIDVIEDNLFYQRTLEESQNEEAK